MQMEMIIRLLGVVRLSAATAALDRPSVNLSAAARHNAYVDGRLKLYRADQRGLVAVGSCHIAHVVAGQRNKHGLGINGLLVRWVTGVCGGRVEAEAFMQLQQLFETPVGYILKKYSKAVLFWQRVLAILVSNLLPNTEVVV
jgi:hypothetical protein